MRKTLKSFVVALNIIGLGVAVPVLASDNAATNNKPPMSYILKTTGNIISLGDEINIDAYIRNETTDKTNIYKRPSSGEIYISTYVNGKKITKSDWFDVPDEVTKKEDFIELSPNQLVKISGGGFGFEYLNKPGKWAIQIAEEYKVSGKDVGVKSWTGKVISDEIEVLVEDNTPENSDIALEASVALSKIGGPEDKIDAYVRDTEKQYYFVKFNVDKVLKGEFTSNNIGVCLHSPALTFRIGKTNYEGKKYILYLRKKVLENNRTVLLVQPGSKAL
jgi:hypothetical protein